MPRKTKKFRISMIDAVALLFYSMVLPVAYNMYLAWNDIVGAISFVVMATAFVILMYVACPDELK